MTTGISAYDRAHTIQVAIDPRSTAQDLARPGHVFPLRARKGGVLVRAGQTEASVDLARLAGLIPAGVICEIMNDDGTMARVPDLIEFCKEHGLKMLTVAELIRYRLQQRAVYSSGGGEHDADPVRRLPHDCVRERGGWRREPCGAGDGAMSPDAELGDEPVLVRVHSHCLAGDVFGTTLCDCHAVMRQFAADDCGGGMRGADLSAQREQGI